MLVSRRVATLLENSAVCSRLQQRVTLSYDVAVQAAKQLQALPTMNPRMALSMRYRIMRLTLLGQSQLRISPGTVHNVSRRSFTANYLY